MRTAEKTTEIHFEAPTPPTIANLPAATAGATVPEVASESASILTIIERASRDPSVNIDKLDRLLQMQERVQARQAQVEYDNAMAAAQEEIKRIAADKDNNQTKSQYATLAAVDRAIRPIITRHGFSVTFSSGEAPADLVRLLATVAHRGGHREVFRLDMPADGKGAKGGDVMTKTHATGAAITYGKRYLHGMIWNLAIGEDDDGNGADSDEERLAPEGALRNKEGKLLSTYASTKAKDYTSMAIETINLSGNPQAVKDWRHGQCKAPKGSNVSPLAWLEFNAPTEFQRVKMAYENATGEAW